MDNQFNQYDNRGGYNNGGNGNGNGSGNGAGGNGNGGEPPKRPSMLVIVLATLGMLVVLLSVMRMFSGNNAGNQVSYTQFLQYVEQDQVDTVNLQSTGEIEFTLKEGTQSSDSPANGYGFGLNLYMQNTPTQYTTIIMEEMDTLTARLEAHGIEGRRTLSDSSEMILNFVLSVILPIVLMWILLSLLFRRMSGSGGPMGVGKSNAKVYVQKETGVTFKDVAGEDEAMESLVEVVDFLHNPGKYSKIGAKLPKGALLVGPPGTGKTLLARAVAGEAHVPFFSLTGSDFIELYVGVGASRVRDLFREATKNAPCIIFIDEIDAIGRSRDSKYGGGDGEREQTLNQLLSEMDGFDSSKGILILGATNRPEILDKALLRPGRFDRRIIVDKPDLKGRVEILKVHARDVKMDESVDLDAIALATSGAVGSDLANMINEAAINAVKEGREYVSQKDLLDAVEVVLVGKEKKDRIMNKTERRIVSYHEVGHALISALQKNSEPVQKITIVPRTMGALGYVMQVPEEEKYLNTEAELRDMLVSLVGGRAAEELVFDTVTTGAANDIERATSIARNMVTRYGMSRKFGMVGLATIESQYLENRAELVCSDETAAQIDAEVVEILKESYEKALAMLKENREIMDKIAEYLIEKETITGKEFMEIFRREKGIPEPEPAAESQSATAAQAAEGQSAGAEQAVEGQSASAEQAAEGQAARAEQTDPAQAAEGQSASAEQIDPAQAAEGQTAGAEQTDPAQAAEGQSATAGQTGAGENAAVSQQPVSTETSDDLPPQQDSPVGRFSNGRLD